METSCVIPVDPLQFAYKPGIGVDDAVIYLLHRSLSHLESTGSTVRAMFFDFSSAFNTIHPSLLRGKLEGAGVDCHLAAWTTDYLTNRPQYVRLRDCVSDVVVCSMGAPQGTVFSPFLFTLYTSDSRLPPPEVLRRHSHRCTCDRGERSGVQEGRHQLCHLV